MDPAHTYDYLTRARRLVFEWTRSVAPADYGRIVAPWRMSLGATLTHVMTSEWYYRLRMERRVVPPYEDWPAREENPPAITELEALWTAQAAETQAALAAVADWNAPIEYPVTGDDGVPFVVTTTPGGIATQLVLHEVHHRGQVLMMLRTLGIAAGDVDYNLMTYGRRPVQGGSGGRS